MSMKLNKHAFIKTSGCWNCIWGISKVVKLTFLWPFRAKVPFRRCLHHTKKSPAFLCCTSLSLTPGNDKHLSSILRQLFIAATLYSKGSIPNLVSECLLSLVRLPGWQDSEHAQKLSKVGGQWAPPFPDNGKRCERQGACVNVARAPGWWVTPGERMGKLYVCLSGAEGRVGAIF